MAIKAMESMNDVLLLVSSTSGEFVIANLTGGELFQDEVDFINSLFPGAVPVDYVVKVHQDN